MKSIKGANIFKVGTHGRDYEFTEADLDSIVKSFDEAKLSGRVPLKYGHNDDQPMTDGQPALGWVTKLWRAGKDLMADFSNIPDVVYKSITSGLYRFTSIELLKNAKYGDQKFPFVLDAVALLGADPPAVQGLQALDKLTARRQFPAMKFSARTTYAIESKKAAKSNDDRSSAEIARLKQELEEARAFRSDFTQTAVNRARLMYQREMRAKVENAVRDGGIPPAARLHIIRDFKLDDADCTMQFTPAMLNTMIKFSGNREHFKKMGKSTAIGGIQEEPSVAQKVISKVREQYVREGGTGRTSMQPTLKRYLAENPDAAQEIWEQFNAR